MLFFSGVFLSWGRFLDPVAELKPLQWYFLQPATEGTAVSFLHKSFILAIIALERFWKPDPLRWIPSLPKAVARDSRISWLPGLQMLPDTNK